jgi:tagatose-6-phosphate ketose/aldose isomerase
VPQCDTYLPIETELADVHRPTLDVLFGQMLGLLYIARTRFASGCAEPRWRDHRVVQDFAIYR